MFTEDELFGTPERVALIRRSMALWSLVGDDPRFAYYGRLVGLSGPVADTPTTLSSLARVQGGSVCYFYPATDADTLGAKLGANGFLLDRHQHFRGGEAVRAASEKVLAEYALPSDLTVSAIDARTPHALVGEVAALSAACEVMPVPGTIMRGIGRKGICLFATDREGGVVATASSYMIHHEKSPHATDAFWGMLATREDRRGERIALILGARAAVHMWETYGARGFMTGVRAGNTSSAALCNKLGVCATEWIYASCIDPSLFSESRVTK